LIAGIDLWPTHPKEAFINSLAKLAEELGITVDYLVTGKESSIVDTIPAIKADKKLSLETKKALITLGKKLYETHSSAI
jgi:hypothetical protein